MTADPHRPQSAHDPRPGADRGRALALMLFVGAFAAGVVLGPLLAPGAPTTATAAGAPDTATSPVAARVATADAATAARPAAESPAQLRAHQRAQRQAARAATQAAQQRAERRAARQAAAAVPLTVRYPTVAGQTVAPGPRVTARIPATLPLPARSGTGRRIVYGASAQHLWIVAADGTVVRDYPVTGRVDRPGPGRYRVYSKSPASSNPVAKVTFTHMVRFAHGVTGAAIGFHSIPRWYDGTPLQTAESLGLALGRGGCIRQTDGNARFLYRWSRVGDRVVVVA